MSQPSLRALQISLPLIALSRLGNCGHFGSSTVGITSFYNCRNKGQCRFGVHQPWKGQKLLSNETFLSNCLGSVGKKSRFVFVHQHKHKGLQISVLVQSTSGLSTALLINDIYKICLDREQCGGCNLSSAPQCQGQQIYN